MSRNRFRPGLEQLEAREMLSATVANSTLGGVAVSFSLNNGILSEIKGPQVGVVTNGVQALYQTTDNKGHQVVFDWVNSSLNEFTPNQGWLDVSSVDQVAQDGINNALLFTHANTLYLVTGAPGTPFPSSTTSRV